MPLPGQAAAQARAPRRGVAAMLAVIAMTLLTAMAFAMAVVAQGNVRTADSHLKVSRAMSAAETGLNFAARRLAKESRRFVTTEGVVSAAYGEALWTGSYPNDGSVEVLPPVGYVEAGLPDGIAQAVMNAHLADEDDFDADLGDASFPKVFGDGTLRVKPIALTRSGSGFPDADGPWFRLKYELVQGTGDTSFVRVTSRGVDGLITRTLQMDFKLTKKIEFAVVGPSRIMIGKNVRVEGPLGTRYGLVGTCSDTPPGELCSANGDPLVMRSDFYYLAGELDTRLNTYFAAMAANDADGDGRLRVHHEQERVGLNHPDLQNADYDGNEYVDDFDLFLEQFDTNPQDGKVVYDSTLAGIYSGTPPVEFTEDLQLAMLIDHATPDRDADGVITLSDNLLGYNDGCLDVKDNYAKVKGRLFFAIGRDQWQDAHGGTYQTVVHGPIVPGLDAAPVTFDATEEELRELTTEMLQTSQSWYESQVEDLTLAEFLANAQGGVYGGTYTPKDESVPGTWESIPFDAQGAYDFIARPQFRNATFRNIRIPMGANALFEDCTFIGVTFIETYEHCVDEYWNYAGAKQYVVATNSYDDKFDPDIVKANLNPPAGLEVLDTKPYSNCIRFHNCTFIGSVAGDKPEKLTHWRNKIMATGNTRFYIDPDDPDLHGADAQPDAATILAALDSIDADVRKELAKSQWYMAGWSVDVGNFNNEVNPDPALTPRVNFRGCIIAGLMDVRGTADVFGTMLNTFHPVANDGPLFFGGLPDAFNATIGYFGPEDGDGEGVNRDEAGFTGFGEITLRYDPDALLPDGIPWFVTAEPAPLTYFEGGTM
jgi:hypothetical protein